MTRLYVAAFAEEAAYLPEGVELLLTGLGKTAAAAAVARRLASGDAAPVTEVVNLGTAGALRDGLSGVFTPGTVLNHDVNAAIIRELGVDPQERLEVGGGDGTVLATGDVFVADPALRARLAETAHLVDMEGYAVVWACRAAGVAVRLVKHVSDDADDSAMSWPEQVDRCAQQLGAWVAENLPG